MKSYIYISLIGFVFLTLTLKVTSAETIEERAIQEALKTRANDRFQNEGLAPKALERAREARSRAATTPEEKEKMMATERSLEEINQQKKIAKANSEIRNAERVIRVQGEIADKPDATLAQRMDAKESIADAREAIGEAQASKDKANTAISRINEARSAAAQERINVQAAKLRSQRELEAIARKNQAAAPRSNPSKGIPTGMRGVGGMSNQGMRGFGPIVFDRIIGWMMPDRYDLNYAITYNQQEILNLTARFNRGELTPAEVNRLSLLEIQTPQLIEQRDNLNK